MAEKGYLICDKCNGHYFLKEGESPDDFGGCECGGSIKFVKNIERSHKENFEELQHSDHVESKICKHCGTDNLFDSSFCINCGENLNKTDITSDKGPEILRKTEDTETRRKLQNKIRAGGMGLIIIGLIQIFSFGMLDPYWGILLVVVGLISFIIVHRVMYVIFGAILLFAGLSNLLAGGGWALFSILQFVVAMREFYQYIKWRKPSDYLK